MQIDNLKDYDIVFSIKDTTELVHDDQSLQHILTSLAVDQPKLQIILRSKRRKSDSLTISNLCCHEPPMPIIKPNVIRWKPGMAKRQRILGDRTLPDPVTLPFIQNSLHPLDHTLPTLSSLPIYLAPIRKRTRASISGVFLCEHTLGPNQICGQTFRRSYDLSRHQTIHLENRPFCYCHQCGKKFTRMDALRRHERVQGHLVSPKPRSMSTSHLLTKRKMHFTS
ncbi:hypothetical protein A0J61_02925 [Choanephora cucurbitarum]|uniref:C2H2-type domain-containing protein n=1 Tax=Choanephora cucurbitarum TaxID=101091 RepID=A0A1C7NIQ1_9FUNG|nr:hypothetical protein A0J61_02925 [Choanephora cucurbitarum]